jgi:hypothetical protein
LALERLIIEKVLNTILIISSINLKKGEGRVPNISFNKLNELYFFILSEHQTFSMGLYDSQSLEDDFTIGYCMDGYDLCRYAFDENFFTGKPNPHHRAMKTTWNSFFHHVDGENIYALISPFTIIELLATIEERSNDESLSKLLTGKYSDVYDIIHEINKGLKKYEEIESEKQNVIKKLYIKMSEIKRVVKTLHEDDIFSQITKPLDNGKIKLFDPIAKEHIPPDKFDNILSGIQNIN